MSNGYDKVTEGLQEILNDEGFEGVLVHWVLVPAIVNFTSEEGNSVVPLFCGPNPQPDYILRGLLGEGLVRLNEGSTQIFLGADDDDDD